MNSDTRRPARFTARPTRLAGLLALACALSILPACARTVLENSAVDAYPRTDDQIQFFEELEKRAVVTNHDALHALLLFADGEDDAPSFEMRAAAAREKGWFKGEIGPANESAQVGDIAVAMCHILDIKGGLSMHLFGKVPRFCTRELIYLELLPSLTAQQALTGLEFTELLGRAERFMQPQNGS